MTCVDPLTRAVTALVASHELTVALPGAGGTVTSPLPALRPWGSCLIGLLPPGPLADVVRASRGQLLELEAPHVSAHPSGPDHHGVLQLAVTARAVPSGGRRQVALQLWEEHPHEHLLSAVADEGWVLVFMDVTAATWSLPSGRFPMDVREMLRTPYDDVLRRSLALCRHLNDHHPQVATWLAGTNAWLVEIDRAGATLVRDDDGGIVRVPWPQHCDHPDDVRRLLLCATERHR